MMNVIALLIFHLSLFLIFYVYLGYPLILAFIGTIRNKPILKNANYLPEITIIIAAYNEEKVIKHTIKNKLELDYPEDKLEIIVVSDESTDMTDDIVKSFEDKRITLLRQKPRAGKTEALNMAFPLARGEILVFSDANSIYTPNALRKLAQNFCDPTIGYVTGKMIYTNPDGSTIGDGCSAYMKYENILRSLETKLGSIVGVDGGIDAIRRQLYIHMNPDQLPDFVLPLNVTSQGFRVIYEPEAILEESALNDPADEYRMRVRVALRSLWAIYDFQQLILLRNFNIFSWQLLSHKVLRYLCFVFLLLVYLSNMALWDYAWFYKIFFIVQTICVLCAGASFMSREKGHKSKLLYLCHYFMIINIASAHAFIKFISRKKIVVWTPRQG